MKNQYRLGDSYNIYVKVIYTELLHRLHPVKFDIFHFEIRHKINSMIHYKLVGQERELKEKKRHHPVRKQWFLITNSWKDSNILQAPIFYGRN